MKNIRRVLEVFLKRVSVKDILYGRLVSSRILKNDFVMLMRSYSDRFSDTELENLYRYYISLYNERYHSLENVQSQSNKMNVFNMLGFCSEGLLTVQDNEIVCIYEHFLKWRNLTNVLSEDILVTSYLAIRELRSERKRCDFGWKISITHNNRELHRIINQGMCENHSHLKGAAPIYHLSWVSLMNDLSFHYELGNIDKNRRTVYVGYNSNYQEGNLATELLQAVAIRLVLFTILMEDQISEIIRNKVLGGKGEAGILQYITSPEMLVMHRGEMKSIIYSFQSMPTNSRRYPDYAMRGPVLDGADARALTLAYQGERWLMYNVFRLIFTKSAKMRPYYNLFYAYLVIREHFRAELIQSNRSVGFENFRIYEMRKDIFLERSFFQQAMIKKAIENSLFDTDVISYEARITPKSTARENMDYISRLDNWIAPDNDSKARIYYVAHFIKEEDKELFHYGTCRHYSLRNRVKKQGDALVEFRLTCPEKAARIKGIDAANMEIGCGPEVFAQTFRYLSDHTVTQANHYRQKKLPQLRKTYHVGEDFLDVVSGLRAIDEAIRFLNLSHGDRLGHATVLGVDIRKWYEYKGYTIILTQQEFMDNLMWLHHLCYILGAESHFEEYLRKEFGYYFQNVYGNAIERNFIDNVNESAIQHYQDTEWASYYSRRYIQFSIESYYSAWKLRSDNPELYKKGYFDNSGVLGIHRRTDKYYAVNYKLPARQNKRYQQEVAMLYYYYHYNKKVREEGSRTIELDVGEEYIKAAILIQNWLQKKISRLGIGIEANPTSNLRINTFSRYIDHPILNLYNKHLENRMDLDKSCEQLNISINTDDAGIFGTSLENEFSCMACALELEKNQDGTPRYSKKDIYAWIDDIRKMGLSQTFLSDDERIEAIEAWKKKCLNINN